MKPVPESEGPEAVTVFHENCLADVSYPEAGLAGIRLIRREGVEIVYRQGTTCRGQPAFDGPRRTADIEQTLASGIHGSSEARLRPDRLIRLNQAKGIR